MSPSYQKRSVHSDSLQIEISHYWNSQPKLFAMPFFYPPVPPSRALTSPALSQLGTIKDSLNAPKYMDYNYREETEHSHHDWYDTNKYAPTKYGSGPLVLPSLQSGYEATALDARYRNKDIQGSNHGTAPVSSINIPPSSTNVEGTYYSNVPPVHAPAPAQAPAAAKEEKVVGGVSVHLDYEMEHMAEFVAEMAQGIVHFRTAVSTDFRKYVLQVLSSTRLPSSTILLGLHYLATRMSMLPYNADRSSASFQLYHLLTTALLLGSKFLDDNTFQNRSWSEVSNIPVAELNRQEIEWLVDIKWDMHIKFESQGFYAWIDKWNDWKAKRMERSLTALKLTPLDTSMRQQRPLSKPHQLSPMYPSHTDSNNSNAMRTQQQPHWLPPVQDWSTTYRRSIDYSPPSAPPTGPTTPDWYGFANFGSHVQNNQAFSSRTMPIPVATMPSHSSYYRPQQTQNYPGDPWGRHEIGCRCGYCIPYYDRFTMMRGSGMQTVAG